ncbi:hypothetical protein ACSVDA_24545 [Cytobacillus sp. Hm23]
MKNTKKFIATASLSALLLGGGATAYQSYVSAATPSYEFSQAQDSYVKVETYEDFDNVQYKDFKFRNFDKFIQSVEFTKVDVDTEVFNKYAGASMEYMLHEIENPELDSAFIEAAKKHYSTVDMDPWTILYMDVKNQNIDTTGKTFGQVEEELYGGMEISGYVGKSEKEIAAGLSKDFGFVDLEGKTKDELVDVYSYAIRNYFGIETTGKTFEEFKEEFLKYNASERLKEETKDLPYDSNWLIEKEDWWIISNG